MESHTHLPDRCFNKRANCLLPPRESTEKCASDRGCALSRELCHYQPARHTAAPSAACLTRLGLKLEKRRGEANIWPAHHERTSGLLGEKTTDRLEISVSSRCDVSSCASVPEEPKVNACPLAASLSAVGSLASSSSAVRKDPSTASSKRRRGFRRTAPRAFPSPTHFNLLAKKK